jgi:hypothetical protein
MALKASEPATCRCAVGFAFALLAVLTGAAPPETFTLSGTVLKASGNSDVYLTLWQAEGVISAIHRSERQPR